MNDTVYALVLFDDGGGEALYAGGKFVEAGGIQVNYIAKWDGVQWSALEGPSGFGVNHHVYSLAVYDDGGGETLYVGGRFTEASGITVNRIVRWDGAVWEPLYGPSEIGLNSSVSAMTVYDDGEGATLVLGGSFTVAGGIPVNRIAKWDGATLSSLDGNSGLGVNDDVSSLAEFDGGSGKELFAGGRFTHAGGVLVNHIAKWDGAEWSALNGPSAPGLDDNVSALGVFDDGGGEELYVGGKFHEAGGVAADFIVKWDGAEWSTLDGQSSAWLGYYVYALEVFDGVFGKVLCVGGYGGIEGDAIALWGGNEWSALSGNSSAGVGGSVFALAEFDQQGIQGLFVGGNFGVIGGLPSSRFAQWGCDTRVFSDGFESGDTSSWSATQP